MYRVLFSLALVALLTPSVHADPTVYDKGVRSTALIVCHGKTGLGNGSGVLVDAQRKWVLTNYHVATMEGDCRVLFPEFRDGAPIPEVLHYAEQKGRKLVGAKVIALDAERDLALLEVDRIPTGIVAATLSQRSPRPGETLHAVGNSGFSNGVLWRYFRGEVRQVAKQELHFPNGQVLKARVVEGQLPSNPGDSGGPVFDGQGRLVALTQGMRLDRNLVNYAVDIQEIRAFLNDVLHEGRTKKSDTWSQVPTPKSVTEPHASRLVQKWSASVPNAAGILERWSFQFMDDGQCVLRKGTDELDARYTWSDDRLQVQHPTLTLAGQVHWVGSGCFILRDHEGRLISFHKQ